MRCLARSALTLLAITAALTQLPGCASASRRAELYATQPPPPLVTATPSLTLTCAWNRQTYSVPAPAVIPPEMQADPAMRRWWKVGNFTTLQWTGPDGRRYDAEAWCKVVDADGQTKPVIPYVSRYRPDGTLEARTTNDAPRGPAEWTLYAPDGKTKAVDVTTIRDSTGTRHVQSVIFYDANGIKTRQYEANPYGVIYLESFYKPNGELDHQNGSAELNRPLDQLAPPTASAQP